MVLWSSRLEPGHDRHLDNVNRVVREKLERWFDLRWRPEVAKAARVASPEAGNLQVSARAAISRRTDLPALCLVNWAICAVDTPVIQNSTVASAAWRRWTLFLWTERESLAGGPTDGLSGVL